jgi:3-oxoacyl-[acyl-carrier-protein] synthase-3
MSKVHAAITAVGGYLPDYTLDNHELSTMVDTSDEWIMTRIGIRKRHILKEKNKGSSYMAAKAVEEILQKTGTKPNEIDLIICATSTPDHIFPATAAIACERVGIKGALAFDIQAACSGFIVAITTAASLIETKRYKKARVVSAEKMSSIVDYQDRTTAPIFGDGAGAVLLEPTTASIGVMDSILYSDPIGVKHLHLKAGGSAMPASLETVEKRLHYIYQEGQAVFKHAVSDMADVSAQIMERNNLTSEDVAWLIPHQANLRIIDAVQRRTGVDYSKVLINIEHTGNTSAASIPIGLWEMEEKFKKGDNIILTAFGAGFTWGAVYLKWGY